MVMLLLIHIVAAVSGLSAAAASILTPSRRLLGAAYGLLAVTIVSGGSLIWYVHAPVTSTCVSGVIYTAVMLTLTAVGKVRLARTKIV
jgi:hypothetical protein